MGKRWAKGLRLEFLQHRLPGYHVTKGEDTVNVFTTKVMTEWWAVYADLPDEIELNPLLLGSTPDETTLKASEAIELSTDAQKQKQVYLATKSKVHTLQLCLLSL